MCTSPAPRKLRSNPPYLATCSSMWSRKARPVVTFTRPRPSSVTRAVSCVSLLLRTTSATLLKAYLDCVRVGSQPFHRGQADDRISQHLEVAAVEAQDAAPF